jgi:catechol 2,3-dioxygenase-like lactoylglutathione lyase family enzyme
LRAARAFFLVRAVDGLHEETVAAAAATQNWRDPDSPPANMEATMSSTQTITEEATGSRTAAAVDLKLEVVVIPVADVDRAKRFYESLGWRLDADFSNDQDWRVVQMTPPGSPCSVMFGKGFTTAVPGSAQGTFLVVDDLEAARAELTGHGVDVSEAFHFEGNLIRVAGTKGRVPGLDPKGASYFSFASFSDPDGNSWLVQEVKTRFPGRGFSSMDVATLTGILQDAEKRHGEYEAVAPKHHWSQWYAGYIVARERGKTSDAAAADAALHMERTARRAHE